LAEGAMTLNVTLAALTAAIKVKAINDRDFIYNIKKKRRKKQNAFRKYKKPKD
jgi:hypothetical protein